MALIVPEMSSFDLAQNRKQPSRTPYTGPQTGAVQYPLDPMKEIAQPAAELRQPATPLMIR
jgi:hypothetical protein